MALCVPDIICRGGRCPRHPFVQLHRPSSCTGHWVTLLESCPICEVEEKGAGASNASRALGASPLADPNPRQIPPGRYSGELATISDSSKSHQLERIGKLSSSLALLPSCEEEKKDKNGMYTGDRGRGLCPGSSLTDTSHTSFLKGNDGDVRRSKSINQVIRSIKSGEDEVKNHSPLVIAGFKGQDVPSSNNERHGKSTSPPVEEKRNNHPSNHNGHKHWMPDIGQDDMLGPAHHGSKGRSASHPHIKMITMKLFRGWKGTQPNCSGCNAEQMKASWSLADPGCNTESDDISADNNFGEDHVVKMIRKKNVLKKKKSGTKNRIFGRDVTNIPYFWGL